METRPKWNKPKRNLRVDDIVLSKDPDLPRNEWKLARVIEAKHSDDGLVRSVKLRMADDSIDKSGKQTHKPSSQTSSFTRE